MKKIILIAFLILFAALAVIYRIQSSQLDTDVTAKATKIGVMLSGSRSDHNYNQAHFEAIESIRNDLNLDVVYRENVPPDCYKDIVSLIRDEDCRIIVGVSYDYGDSMMKAAAEYPDVSFLHASGTGYRHNLSTFFGRMYQARYLSGVVAGMQTKTGELGYIAAFPLSEVIRGINAFTLGVRSVRPDAVVHVRYCGSWVEDDRTGKECKALLDGHPIDVVAMHTDSLAPHREADARGIWSIGCNLDNADLFPKTYLTACVWRWNVYYRKQIFNCLHGKFHGKNEWIDMDEGIVGLSAFTDHVSTRAKAEVQAASERLWKGGFDVFYGPIKDNTGRLRIEAGESMPDDEMLNSFGWYVEGVSIEGNSLGGA